MDVESESEAVGAPTRPSRNARGKRKAVSHSALPDASSTSAVPNDVSEGQGNESPINDIMAALKWMAGQQEDIQASIKKGVS